MKQGGGRAKGSAFERQIAKDVIQAFAKYGITVKDAYRTPLRRFQREHALASTRDMALDFLLEYTEQSPVLRSEHVDTPCLEWTGRRWDKRRGYGGTMVAGKRWRVHRLIWTWLYGPIPDGLLVCHKCDNPICCHPRHLFLGTVSDNAEDMERKGRGNHPTGDRHFAHQHPERFRGERNGAAVVTEKIVREIRRRYSCHCRYPHRDSAGQMSREFGITPTQVRRIGVGKSWCFV